MMSKIQKVCARFRLPAMSLMAPAATEENGLKLPIVIEFTIAQGCLAKIHFIEDPAASQVLLCSATIFSPKQVLISGCISLTHPTHPIILIIPWPPLAVMQHHPAQENLEAFSELQLEVTIVTSLKQSEIVGGDPEALLLVSSENRSMRAFSIFAILYSTMQ